MLEQQLEKDLKAALLSGNKTLATTLRGLKSVLLYDKLEKGTRDKQMSDEELIVLFAKEVKKRQESADLYRQGGNAERAEAELAEKAIIEAYLPQQLSNEELGDIVAKAIDELAIDGPQVMGQVISRVKQQTGGKADGARIAQMTKERLSK